MGMATTKNSTSVDYLLIGNTLTSHLLARAFAVRGASFLIVNGNHATDLSEGLTYLNTIPDAPGAEDLLRWAISAYGKPADLNSRGCQHLTLEDGSLREFVGFGDRCPNSVNDILFLNSAKEWIVSPSVGQWFSAEPTPQQSTTKFLLDGEKISAVEVNGEHRISANQVIYTLSPHHVLTLIDGEGIAAKRRQRLAKMTPWAAVSVVFRHAEKISHSSGLHFLFGGGQQFEPIWGRFLPSDDGAETSHWTTLIPADKQDEHDFAGQVIRNAKRQIRRAYPTLPEDLKEERIVFSPDAYGHLVLKTKEPFRLPEIANLWFACPLLSSLGGYLGAVDVAHNLVTSLDFEKADEAVVNDLNP